MNGPASADLGAPSVAEPVSGPGEMLARARAARGLGLEEVANRLKFGTRQIEALEADDYSRLPGMTFVRGMIRSYAKLLDADPAPMLEALERRHAPAPVAVELPAKKIPFPDGRSRSTRIYLGLSVVVLIIVGAVVYEWHFGVPEPLAPAPGEPQAQAPSEAAKAPEAKPAAPVEAPVPRPAAVAAAPGGGVLVFVFDEQSWVEVRDRNDRVLLMQLNPAGSRKSVDGEAPFELVIGNASHVRLNYRDKPFDLKPHTKVDVARFTLK